MQQSDILAKLSLGQHELAQVQALAEEVLRVDGAALKLDWEFAQEGVPGQANSFCCRVGEQIVGYALLEGSGAELEVTAAVMPAFRRQGILMALLGAVKEEAQRRGATELLLVSYRNSVSGTAATQALGLLYTSSEYRMEADADALPVLETGRVTLETVEVADAAELAQMLTATFGREKYSVDAVAARLQETNARYFFARVKGTQIGQIGVVDTGESIYIRGVGVLSEYRHQGYGRQVLATVLQAMRDEGQTKFVLDVATENPAALSIYKACGFHETTVYDYYDVFLTKET